MKVEGKVSYEIESNNMKDFKPSRPVINRWVLLILSTAVFYNSPHSQDQRHDEDVGKPRPKPRTRLRAMIQTV